jgi:zinc/manganese transport system substrate-binding protein
VIVNGIGYDNWASQLLAANPVGGRVVLDVGALLGLRQGANPHQWYDPSSVEKVIGAITADLAGLDPGGRAYYAAQRRHYEHVSLARYDTLRAEIRRRYAGVPVGYSESIFEPLGGSLRLRLLTPPGFAKAVSEGTEVTASEIAAVDRQVRKHRIKVWIFNGQNVTPEVQQVNSLAAKAGIPIVTVTETLSPASLDFEQWQDRQLAALAAALHRATGR